MNLQETKKYTMWLTNRLCIVLILIFFLSLQFFEDLNPITKTLIIRRDVITGCQYLESWNGQLIKRTDYKGKHMGCAKVYKVVYSS